MLKEKSGDASPTIASSPRVVVFVRGGVAEVVQDNGVEVYIMDYDNEPNGRLPERFGDLVGPGV